MNRAEAASALNDSISLVNGFKSVPKAVVAFLFKDQPERYECLLADPIRKKGPTDDTIYPWNVLDYMDDDCWRGLEKRMPKKVELDEKLEIQRFNEVFSFPTRYRSISTDGHSVMATEDMLEYLNKMKVLIKEYEPNLKCLDRIKKIHIDVLEDCYKERLAVERRCREREGLVSDLINGRLLKRKVNE